jgi:hypothetical protein
MALRDRMVAMGFDESEAEAYILAPQGELEGLFTHQPRPRPAFVFELGGGDAADGDGTGSHELANRVREAAPGKIEIVTKTDIMLLSQQWPSTRVKHYDTSPTHVRASVDRSLQRIGVDVIVGFPGLLAMPMVGTMQLILCLEQ